MPYYMALVMLTILPSVKSTEVGHQKVCREKTRPLDSIMRENFDTTQENMQDPAGSGTVALL